MSKLPQHIFALTKGEQRVVIVIVLLVLAGATAKHYRNRALQVALPITEQPAATPAPSDDED